MNMNLLLINFFDAKQLIILCKLMIVTNLK